MYYLQTFSYIITGGFQYSNCKCTLAYFGWLVYDHLSEPIVFDHDSRFVYIYSAICLHFVMIIFLFTFLQPLHPHMLLCCPWLLLPMPLYLELLPWPQVCCYLLKYYILYINDSFLFTFLIIFVYLYFVTAHMMKAGLGMNLVTVLTTLLAINSYAVPLFGLDSFPEWGIPQLPENVTCT